MTQPFPALLIGGPPHSGKSVLSHILSKHLLNRQAAHYLFPATPDGDGKWFHETDRELAQNVRRKRKWDPPFEATLDHLLPRRPLPFLVDVGGRPTPSQQQLFDHCTHTILIGATAEALAEWRQICLPYQLQPLIEIHSVLQGTDEILADAPLLRLQLSGLERHRQIPLSPAWQRLIETVETTLGWRDTALWDYHRNQIATDRFVFNVELWRETHYPQSTQWAPEMLAPLLTSLDPSILFAAYNARPVWLVAALAAHFQAPPTCFDARYGWLTIPDLVPSDSEANWSVQQRPQGTAIGLSFELQTTLIAIRTHLEGPLPAVPAGKTVILDGKLPGWLFGALARYYAHRGHPVAIADLRNKCANQITPPNHGQILPWEPPPTTPSAL